MTFRELKAIIRKAGCRVSKGAWESDDAMYAWSIEHTHVATAFDSYTHPVIYAQYDKKTGKLEVRLVFVSLPLDSDTPPGVSSAHGHSEK